jgi:peptidyl-prolyl cis-trans isomerase A (cyclophilin A)
MKKLFLAVTVASLVMALMGCNKHTRVCMKTSAGDIHLELFDSKSPETVKNFLRYVDGNFYDGTIFHRVIPNFMIQGGGFTVDLTEKDTDSPIMNEANNSEKNLRGTVAMARTQDIHSATAQFFINVVDNPNLDHGPHGFGYCVFGKVIRGMDVVDTIRTANTKTLGIYQNVPVEPVVILSFKRE